jgi:RNA polymerase sigma factor (sigma-70 family)
MSATSSEDATLRGADLRRAISRLGHDDRLAVVLYFYLDLPVDEVATVTGKSVGATRTQLHRAVKKLRPGVAIEEALR